MLGVYLKEVTHDGPASWSGQTLDSTPITLYFILDEVYGDKGYGQHDCVSQDNDRVKF